MSQQAWTTNPHSVRFLAGHLLALRQLALCVPQLARQLLHTRLGTRLPLLRLHRRSPVACHMMWHSVQQAGAGKHGVARRDVAHMPFTPAQRHLFLCVLHKERQESVQQAHWFLAFSAFRVFASVMQASAASAASAAPASASCMLCKTQAVVPVPMLSSLARGHVKLSRLRTFQ